jgi:hypothetical protein
MLAWSQRKQRDMNRLRPRENETNKLNEESDIED